jgi:hypothetical protein
MSKCVLLFSSVRLPFLLFPGHVGLKRSPAKCRLEPHQPGNAVQDRREKGVEEDEREGDYIGEPDERGGRRLADVPEGGPIPLLPDIFQVLLAGVYHRAEGPRFQELPVDDVPRDKQEGQ